MIRGGRAIVLSAVLGLAASAQGKELAYTTVRPVATREALVNPGMGWVYYHFDDSNWNYGSQTRPGDVLDWFPGVSVAYFRIPWRDLEPEEGVYRWDVIDTVAQPWIASGKQIAFRFTCSESSYEFAVPEWLPGTGAKGRFCLMKRDPSLLGRRVWEPDWLDKTFLEKYGRFLAAAARKWDGHPSVAFVDVGSFGMWGEGHTGFTSNLSPEKTREAALVHAKLLKRHFPRTPLLISDDVAGPRNRSDDDSLMQEMRSLGVGLRDDSIMVAKRPDQWFHAEWAKKFAEAGLPVMVESRHFFPNYIPGSWYEGGLKESTEAYRASFQAIHWWPDDFLRENRKEIDEVNLRLGYRFELREVSWPGEARIGEPYPVRARWANVGVAAPREELSVCWTLLDDAGIVRWTSVDETFDLRGIPPTEGRTTQEVERESTVRFGWKWPCSGNYYGTPEPGVRHDGTVVRFGTNVPTLAPGVFTMSVSVGLRDGSPRITLPLANGSGRRYPLGRIRIVDGD